MRKLFIALAAIGAAALIVGITMYAESEAELEKERREYAALADEFVIIDPPVDEGSLLEWAGYTGGHGGKPDAEERGRTLIKVDFDSLQEINPDAAGWILIKGTPVNYPIMQAGNNSHYLGRSFYGERSNSGAVFADYRIDIDESPVVVLYGHNMGRSETTQFSSLRGYENIEYLEAHPEAIIATPGGGASAWRVFAAVHADSTSAADVRRFYKGGFEDEDEFDRFLADVADRRFYDSGIGPSYGDRILTLSTCVSGRRHMRMVVYAYQERQLHRPPA